ncbi:hypothetical protein BCR37DRAFT_389588 [Protomyces lactucae-debilis]|uniref:Coilin n=1 Tax=Protomyces lactucae-debilis TaxID=2754530 RepID=A0A1Y2EVZ2_PROLT|nr:uncharacterized protein BCR37DRAFT_389588 [Protomyces lactucae-debilis]ORY75763.1 hypothetical protein BCR37DRAFT_389588 [Protomyces lactucae-debilis]
MRIRIKSSLQDLQVKCWWEISPEDSDKTVSELIQDLQEALSIQLPLTSLELQLDGYILMPQSRVLGLLREDDTVVLRQALQSIRPIKGNVADEPGQLQLQAPHPNELDTLVNAVQHLTKTLESNQHKDLGWQEPSTQVIAQSNTPRDEADSSDSTSSSASSSSSDSSSDTSSDEPDAEPPKKKLAMADHDDQVNGIPFEGTSRTAKRNDRRRKSRLLQSLVQAGELRKGSTFKDLDRWHVYNYGSKSFGMQRADKSDGEVSEQDESPSEYSVRGETNDQAIVKPQTIPLPTANLPAPCLASPEPDWECFLSVKRIECEDEYTEEDLPVMQYVEHQYVQMEPRGKKRKRKQAKAPYRLPAAEDNDEFNADLYGEPTTLDAHPVESMDDAVAASQLTADDLPALPLNLHTLQPLNANSAELREIGRIIAFRQLVMVNYEPQESDYKTGKIVETDGSFIKLQLAKRDVEPTQYDYDGNRILGKFEVEGEEVETEEGYCWVDTVELIDPLLLQ